MFVLPKLPKGSKLLPHRSLAPHRSKTPNFYHEIRGQIPHFRASAWFLFLVVRCRFSTSKALPTLRCPSPKPPHPVSKDAETNPKIYPKVQEMCVFYCRGNPIKIVFLATSYLKWIGYPLISGGLSKAERSGENPRKQNGIRKYTDQTSCLFFPSFRHSPLTKTKKRKKNNRSHADVWRMGREKYGPNMSQNAQSISSTWNSIAPSFAKAKRHIACCATSSPRAWCRTW